VSEQILNGVTAHQHN